MDSGTAIEMEPSNHTMLDKEKGFDYLVLFDGWT